MTSSDSVDSDGSTDAASAVGGADPVIDRIRDSVRAIADIAERPLAEHADVYAAVHTQLQGELAEIAGGTSAS